MALKVADGGGPAGGGGGGGIAAMYESFTLGWLNVLVQHMWLPVLEKFVSTLVAEKLQIVLHEVRGRPPADGGVGVGAASTVWGSQSVRPSVRPNVRTYVGGALRKDPKPNAGTHEERWQGP